MYGGRLTDDEVEARHARELARRDEGGHPLTQFVVARGEEVEAAEARGVVGEGEQLPVLADGAPG
eukprot:scaffold68486_cov27-Phaeocystis_antarctica.AAC.1